MLRSHGLVFPGRATRSLRCKRCGADAVISARLDVARNVVVASGRCDAGHEFSTEWANGEAPPALPVESAIEFVPFARGVVK